MLSTSYLVKARQIFLKYYPLMPKSVIDQLKEEEILPLNCSNIQENDNFFLYTIGVNTTIFLAYYFQCYYIIKVQLKLTMPIKLRVQDIITNNHSPIEAHGFFNTGLIVLNNLTFNFIWNCCDAEYDTVLKKYIEDCSNFYTDLNTLKFIDARTFWMRLMRNFMPHLEIDCLSQTTESDKIPMYLEYKPINLNSKLEGIIVGTAYAFLNKVSSGKQNNITDIFEFEKALSLTSEVVHFILSLGSSTFYIPIYLSTSEHTLQNVYTTKQLDNGDLPNSIVLNLDKSNLISQLSPVTSFITLNLKPYTLILDGEYKDIKYTSIYLLFSKDIDIARVLDRINTLKDYYYLLT